MKKTHKDNRNFRPSDKKNLNKQQIVQEIKNQDLVLLY